MAKPVRKKRARQSLADFARENPPGKPGYTCWPCKIPEAEEINAARRAGVAIPVIKRWLIEKCSYTAEEIGSKLMHHFSTNRHHERDAAKALAAR